MCPKKLCVYQNGLAKLCLKQYSLGDFRLQARHSCAVLLLGHDSFPHQYCFNLDLRSSLARLSVPYLCMKSAALIAAAINCIFLSCPKLATRDSAYSCQTGIIPLLVD